MFLFRPKEIAIKRKGNLLFYEEDLSKQKLHKVKFVFERDLHAYVSVDGYFGMNSIIEQDKVYDFKKDFKSENIKIYVIDQKRQNTGFTFSTGGSIDLFYTKESDFKLKAGYTATIELCIKDGPAFLDKYRDLSPEEVKTKLQDMCYTEGTGVNEIYLGNAIKQVLHSYVNSEHILYASPTTYSLKDMQNNFQQSVIQEINANLSKYGFNCINFSFTFNRTDAGDKKLNEFTNKESQIENDRLDEKTRRIRKEDERDDRNFQIEMEKAKNKNDKESIKTNCPYCHKEIIKDKQMKHCPYCGMYIGE